MSELTFSESISQHQAAFGVKVSASVVEKLEAFYREIVEGNEFLHLVGPCSAEEFATRHILESLTMLPYLPKHALLADVGAGGGLPSIPCLIVREDIRAILIESKLKKTDFLNKTATILELDDRIKVVNKQFEETNIANVSVVCCRAIDKFTDKLPRLLKWSGKRKVCFFGGESLANALQENGINFVQKLMPLSERRFLFVFENRYGK